MHLKVQGLVVRTTPYKDSDLLLTLLTADHGRITAKVCSQLYGMQPFLHERKVCAVSVVNKKRRAVFPANT